MSTPIPQAVLDQVAADAAANAPKNLLNQWVQKIKSFGGKPSAPAPTSSAAQVARDAKAGGNAMRNYASSQGAGSNMGLMKNAGGLATALSVGATVGTNMRETMPQSTFVSGRGGGSRATNNPRKNTPDPEYSTNPVKPSQPEGEVTKFADLRGSVTPGSNEPAATNLAEGASMDAAERSRPGAGYPSGVTRPDDYPVAFVPDSTGGGGGNRNNSRVIPGSGGSVQKGTDMSRSFNDLLATTNTSGYQPFGSNQLPTTASNPFSAQPPKTMSFDTGAENYTGNSLVDFGGDGSAAFAQSRERTGNDTFNPNAARIEGGSSRKKGGSLDEALADTAGMQSYMSKFSSGDQERAANRAFLDTEKSMEALRAKEAVNGVVFAQNKHYISGESGDDQAIGIDRSQARDISNGKSSAQSLLAAHIDKNKNASTPAEAQEPMTIEKPGVKQSFGRSETISAPIDTSIPDTTAFNINNGVDVPSFENKGGYKPTSKKPAVDYSKIFS